MVSYLKAGMGNYEIVILLSFVLPDFRMQGEGPGIKLFNYWVTWNVLGKP